MLRHAGCHQILNKETFGFLTVSLEIDIIHFVNSKNSCRTPTYSVFFHAVLGVKDTNMSKKVWALP